MNLAIREEGKYPYYSIEKLRAKTSGNQKQSQWESACRSQQDILFLTDKVQYIAGLS